MVLALLFAAQTAMAADDLWDIPDAGWAVRLPADWEVPSGGWTEWSLKARHTDGSIMQIWVTPYQIPVDKDSVGAWSKMYEQQIADEASAEVQVRGQEVLTIAGRSTGHVSLDVKVKGGDGVAEVYAVEGPGRTIHARVVTGDRKAAKATAALREVVESAKVTKAPLPVGGRTLKSEKGEFAVTLPEGWRPPLSPEESEVAKIVGTLGLEALDTTVCAVGILPKANENPDLTLLCPTALHLDPLDEYSVQGIEDQLHERFFGRAKAEVPEGEAVTIGDRMGLLFRPPSANGAFRLAVAPYNLGILTWWTLGSTDGPTLDAALSTMRPTVQFTGNNAGAPIVRADRQLAYWLTYRTTSPVVLGPLALLLALIGAIGFKLTRKPAAIDDDE